MILEINIETSNKKWNWKSPDWLDTILTITLIVAIIYAIVK